MNLDTILSALEADASVLVKLAPKAAQGISLYKQYQGATDESTKLGVIAQGVALANDSGVTLGDVATVLSSLSTAAKVGA